MCWTWVRFATVAMHRYRSALFSLLFASLAAGAFLPAPVGRIAQHRKGVPPSLKKLHQLAKKRDAVEKWRPNFRPWQWLGAAAVALPRPLVWIWRRLPSRLPKLWLARGLTTDLLGQAAFLASNVAYLGAGARLLLVREAPKSLGVLMMLVCAASSAYHAAQCVHGCSSEPAARACTLDTVLAAGTAGFFVTQVHVEPANAALAALSLAFFTDSLGLGYTLTHSLWHLSTAAAAVVSRPLPPAAGLVPPLRRR